METTEQIIDRIIKDEVFLQRIDRISTPGTKLICIKNSGRIKENYDNFREYLENYYNFTYEFVEGTIYEVRKIRNDKVIIGAAFNGHINGEFSLIAKNMFCDYIFDIFRTIPEDIALTREENINNIIDEEKEK